MTRHLPHRVLIAGGGVAALEGLLALRELAEDRVEVDVLAPNAEFVYRPLEFQALFAHEQVKRFDLPRIVADQGARLIRDRLEYVRCDDQLAVTVAGENVPYDSLLVATGAILRRGIPDAITVAAPGFRQDFYRLLEDLESGLAHSVAFAAPGGMGWLLPLYELALMTADWLSERDVDATVMVVTSEESPMEIFGGDVSQHVESLLEDRDIEVLTSHWPMRAGATGLLTAPKQIVEADRVVALPSMSGPAIPGLPETPGGFLPADDYGRVVGLENVYAAGDGSAFPIKQGGLAAQEAAAAASAIAHAAGAPIEPEPFRPVLRGLLLTGGEPSYLRTDLSHAGVASQTATRPLWWPAAKVAARSLAPYLAARPGLELRPTT